MRDSRRAFVDRRATLAAGVDADALAGALAHLDLAQREAVAIEQLGHFARRGQRFLLGAALLDRLGAQRLYALQNACEFGVGLAVGRLRPARREQSAPQLLE
nr:hypothetical protein [Methylosinus sp. PW1]